MRAKATSLKKWASDNVAKVVVTTVTLASAGWLAKHYDDAFRLMIDNSMLVGAMLLFSFALGMFVAFNTGAAEAYVAMKRDENEHRLLLKTRFMELNPSQRRVLINAFETEERGNVYQAESGKAAIEHSLEQDFVLISMGDYGGLESYRIAPGWRAVAKTAIDAGYGIVD